MKESMRSKLVQLGRRLEEIDAMLSAPDAANDMNRFRDLSRERSELEPVAHLNIHPCVYLCPLGVNRGIYWLKEVYNTRVCFTKYIGGIGLPR